MFAFRQKYKDEGNGLMENLVILIMNSLCGTQTRKEIDQFYKCKSGHWMQTDYDENALEYWELPNGIYIVKIKNSDGLDDNNKVENTLPSDLGAFT